MKASTQKRKTQDKKLCLTFPPELITFLDEFAWDLLKKSGCHRKLDREVILRGLVQAFHEGRFDVTGIRKEEEFVEALLSQIKKKKASRGKRGRGG